MGRALRVGRKQGTQHGAALCSVMPGPRAWPCVPKATFASPQLLSAASLFQLDALQRHCEILCSQTLSVESAVNTYKYAKVRTPGARQPPHHVLCSTQARRRLGSLKGNVGS